MADCYSKYPVTAHMAATDHFERMATAQRRKATTDHTASTNPKGHAPCRKP
jgi:hypothetical protein